ncbi:MAG: cation:proton antiporter [Thermoplasmata archaeon]|nr:cation:proton antiporter [Thermoplasmata archaeon]
MADLQTAFLLSMAVVIAVAALIVVLFHRLRQPLILGYLVAGIVVGPFVTGLEATITPPGGVPTPIDTRAIVELLARLGIVLLTFSIGLEFSFKQLRRIGIAVIAAASLEVLVMIAVGFQLGIALWGKDSTLEATLLGAMLSVASTMIIVRALKESGGLDNEKARLIVGLLVVEDMAAVLILASVSGLVSTGGIETGELFSLVMRMLGFVVVSIVAGLLVIPRLVDYVGRQRSNELLVITVLGLAFSMAYFAIWAGFSEAIGAFVMGVIISESKFIGDVVRRVEPVRDLFGAIFFITVGMLVNLDYFTDTAFIVTALIITTVFVLAKLFACSVSTFLFGFGARNSLGAGLSMIAIGEFSLMIAAVAIGSEAIDETLYPTIVLVTTLTALIVPYSIRYTHKLTMGLERRTPRALLAMASYVNLLVRNIRSRSRSSVHLSNEMRNSITRLAIYILVMVSVSVVATSMLGHTAAYSDQIGVSEQTVLLLILAGTFVVVIFSLIGVWRRTVRIIEVATSEAMLSTKSAENIGYQATSGALKWFFLALYVVIGFIAVAPFVRSLVQQNLLFDLVVIGIIGIALAALWSSVQTVDKKISEIFEMRESTPFLDTSRDLIEIEEIIAAMERAKP